MAQRIFEELRNPHGQAHTLGNLGNLYRDLGKQAQALESHQAALELFVTLENLLGQAQTLTNISLVYVDQGQLDEALRSDQKALELYQQIGHLFPFVLYILPPPKTHNPFKYLLHPLLMREQHRHE